MLTLRNKDPYKKILLSKIKYTRNILQLTVGFVFYTAFFYRTSQMRV